MHRRTAALSLVQVWKFEPTSQRASSAVKKREGSTIKFGFLLKKGALERCRTKIVIKEINDNSNNDDTASD